MGLTVLLKHFYHQILRVAFTRVKAQDISVVSKFYWTVLLNLGYFQVKYLKQYKAYRK